MTSTVVATTCTLIWKFTVVGVFTRSCTPLFSTLAKPGAATVKL